MGPNDEKTVQTYVGYVRDLDKLAFPGKPIKSYVVTEESPPPGESHVHFADTGDPGKDFYLLYGIGFDSYCRAVQAERVHLMLEPLDPSFGIRGMMVHYSFQETLVSIAAHEVRHRVQFHHKVPLIRPEDAIKVPRCRFFAERLAEFLETLSGYQGEDRGREYDAKFVDSYIAYELRTKRAVRGEHVKKLLKMTPDTLLELEQQLTG
ncbi:MAG: hypothetical protein M3Q73_02890 [bacterium]|nr:hypothetical protein [bacterium]